MSSTPPTATAEAGRGYWTDLENRQFDNAVIKCGWGKWREIAGCIPSRSKSQVKSHAQKFAIHRTKEYKELLKKHKVEKKKQAEEEEEQEGSEQLIVVHTPAKKSFRRSSRTSVAARKAATVKSTAPLPVKVRRLSKSSIERADVTVTPTSSFRSTLEESQEVEKLMREINLDAFEAKFEGIDEDSFSLNLEGGMFGCEDEAILSGVSDIPDQSLTIEQQIRDRNSSFMHLRLQVQPDEEQLEQFTNILESPPEWHEPACKCTAMRERILKLARKEEDSGWWRVSPDSLTLDEGVKRAYLERLVALTFAVLQADEWKRSPDVLNAQDDILSICQLFTGIWNRVNRFLAHDGYLLFGMGMDHRQRSDAVAQMVRMFDSIPLQYN